MPAPAKIPPVTPYLTIKGAAAALEFYKKAFGAKENMRMPAEDGKRLMHADVTINGGRVLMSDWFEEYQMDGKVDPPGPKHLAPVAVALHYTKPADVDAAYRRAMEAGCRKHPGAAGHVLGGALCHAQRSLRPSLDDERAAAGKEAREEKEVIA